MIYRDALLEANFKTLPRAHQLREFEAHCETKARAWLWTMRSGKSKEFIDTACHLYTRDLIDAALIVAPNGVHANWIYRELPLHCWDGLNPTTLVWQSTLTGVLSEASKAGSPEQTAFWKGVDAFKHKRGFYWLAINSESMTRPDVSRAVARFIKHRRIILGVDECDDFGTPGSKRTKRVRSIANHVDYKRIMSGTAADSSPLACYSQFEILKRGALGFETFADFKDYYSEWKTEKTRGGRTYPVCTGYRRLPEMRAKIAKLSSVVTREEADMPPLIQRTVQIVPTEKQFEVFRDLRESILTELRGEEVSIGEQAQKLNKLQQVFSGFVIDEFKELHPIPGKNPRLDAMKREAAMLPGKGIVWCQYRYDIKLVTAALRKMGFGVVEVHGGIGPKQKEANRIAFNEEPVSKVKFMVGHRQAGGRGYDLSSASAIYEYSHTTKARLARQAAERASKAGGKGIHIINFVAPGPDKYILRLTRSRMDVADDLAGAGLQRVLRGMDL